MTLLASTFLSVSGYLLNVADCWERNFSLNLLSRNILRRLYPKTGNPVLQNFLIVRISAKKSMLTTKI